MDSRAEEMHGGANRTCSRVGGWEVSRLVTAALGGLVEAAALGVAVPLRAVARSRLLRSVTSLYGAQIAAWVLPFITIPYLTRVLGLETWGRYSLALSVSAQFALLVEYGFGITGSRLIARHRRDASMTAMTVGTVMSAKAILAAGAGAIALIEYAYVSQFHDDPLMFWLAVVAGVFQGANFSWFLYGLEKISGAVALDVGGRLLGVGGLLLVRGPADAWRFFAAQVVASLAVVVFGLWYVLCCTDVRWPLAGAVLGMLRQGASAMLCRPGLGVYMGFYTFVLGLFGTTGIVGEYAGAERIVRGVTALSAPLSLAIFPRLNFLLVCDPARLGRLRWLGGGASIALGFAASVATFMFAPLAVRVVLGPAFSGSVVILRMMSPLPLLAAVNHVLLYQYLLPSGAFGYVAVALVGATGFALLVSVGGRWADNARGVATAVGCAEFMAMVALLVRARRVRVKSA